VARQRKTLAPESSKSKEPGKVRQTKIASALAACALLSIAAAAPTTTHASANANWGRGVELSPPANAAEEPDVSLRKVSCPSAGNCVAAGSYAIPPAHEEEPPSEQGELLSETAGTWERGVEVALPAGAALDPKVEITGLACPSAGNCTAAGEYRDTAEHEQGFLLSESAGVWGAAVQTPLPADASSQPEVKLTQLACPSAGNCVLVGNYYDGSGRRHGFVASETAGSWEAAREAALPADAAPNAEDRLYGIACASAGDCTAVGSYEDAAGHKAGLLWSETAGGWGPGTRATAPANAGSSLELLAVSCPSATGCTAVGEYTDSSGHTEALALNETLGTWGAAVAVPMPANAYAEPDANLHEVQCPAAGDCTAFGIYTAANLEEDDGVFVTETAGVWGAAVERPRPAGAQPQIVIAGSLSCPAAGDCSYVGSYKAGAGGALSRALLATENDARWGPGIEGPLPANVNGYPGAFLSSVACTAPGDCTAVGSYDAYSTAIVERQGMVLTATPASASLSVSGPLGGAFAGSPIAASQISATLAGGADPTGTIAFTVFGPQTAPPSSCAAAGTALAAASASGDGTYQPAADFTPSSPGDYWWYASYGGDAGDEPAASACGPNMAETTVLPKATPTLTVGATAIGALAGSPIAPPQISATLAGGAAPTGTLAFTVFGPQSSPPSYCATGGTAVGTATVEGNGTYRPSSAFTPAAPGQYWWYASYSGDAADEPATAACGAPMAQTLVAAAPGGAAGPGSGFAPGTAPGGGARAAAPTLAHVRLGARGAASRHRHTLTLTFTLSQAAKVSVLVAETFTGHERGGVCRRQAATGRACAVRVLRRHLSFSGSAGPNTFELRLAGLAAGRYSATIAAADAGGRSRPVRLAFALGRG
jgi:hypothetical protein